MRIHICVRTSLRVLLASALLAMLSACATTGTIPGRLGGQTVQLHYQHTFWSQNGTITTVMPSGEKFTGKFVVGSNSSVGVGVGAKSGDIAVIAATGNTSDVAAVLMGDKGESMHCNFTLSKPDAGLEGGGVGRCDTSTGQVIDATS